MAPPTNDPLILSIYILVSIIDLFFNSPTVSPNKQLPICKVHSYRSTKNDESIIPPAQI